jgi:hypothetical protein
MLKRIATTVIATLLLMLGLNLAAAALGPSTTCVPSVHASPIERTP